MVRCWDIHLTFEVTFTAATLANALSNQGRSLVLQLNRLARHVNQNPHLSGVPWDEPAGFVSANLKLGKRERFL